MSSWKAASFRWWRGWVLAEGCLYLQSDDTSRRRILTGWRPGDRVFGLGDGYFHLFAESRRQRAETSGGFVVTRCGTGWSVLGQGPPVRKDHLRYVAQGQVHEVSLAEASEVDAVDWVTVRGAVVELEPLGLPPPPPPRVEVSPAHVDLRARAGIPAPDGDRRAGLQAARDRLRSSKQPTASALVRPGRSSVWGWVRRAWTGLFRPSASQSTPASGGASRGDAGESTSSQPRMSAGRLWWDRLRLWTVGSGVLLSRHRRVLDQLSEQFREGRLDEALRNAIPLGGEGAPSTRINFNPGFAERDRLDVSGPRSGGSAIVGEDEQLLRLRRHYRDAFDTLARDERHAEAAFVLAELLGETQEAVAYLEKAEAFRLAAELADTLKLDPVMRVRLWTRAKDYSRAIALARRHRAFAPAVEGLRRLGGNLHVDLATAWAEDEAELGNFEVAIRVAPEGKARRAWFEGALALDGAAAARVLPRWWAEDASRFEADKGKVEAWMQEPGAPLQSLAEALIDPKVPLTMRQSLLPAICRRYLAQGPTTSQQRSALRRWVNESGDPVLRATWPARVGLRAPRKAERQRVLEPTDRGTQPVMDAVRLESGRWLVALGEGGLQIRGPQGKVLRHAPVAAHKLVVAEAGHRALFLTQRGRFTQVGQIDLATFATRARTELGLSAAAEVYDGREWAIGLAPRGEAGLLDMSESVPSLVWRSRSEGLMAIAREGDLLCQVVRSAGDVWLETFDLPADRLLSRIDLEAVAKNYGETVPSRMILLPRFGTLHFDGRWLRSSVGGDEWIEEARNPRLLAGTRTLWAWTESVEEGAMKVRLRGTSEGAMAYELNVPGACRVGVHEHAGAVCVFDDLGRIEVYSDGGWSDGLRI